MSFQLNPLLVESAVGDSTVKSKGIKPAEPEPSVDLVNPKRYTRRAARDPSDAPCRKLSLHLMQTYQHINNVCCFLVPSLASLMLNLGVLCPEEIASATVSHQNVSKQCNLNHCSRNKHAVEFEAVKGELLGNRYEVVEAIGKACDDPHLSLGGFSVYF